MEKIIQQLNTKVQENLKASIRKEEVENWYSQGVKENMNFMQWLGYVEKEVN